MSGWKRSPKLLASRLDRVKRKVARETAGATGAVLRLFDTKLRSAVKPAKSISKQDDPGGRERRLPAAKPVRVDWRASGEGVAILAAIEGHYTGARGAAVRGAMRYLGRERELYRTSLLVVPGPRKMRARQKLAAGYRAHRVDFSQSSRLDIWSQRTSKGRQELRHVILADKKLMEALIMDPVLRKHRDKFINAWKRGLKEGLV